MPPGFPTAEQRSSPRATIPSRERPRQFARQVFVAVCIAAAVLGGTWLLWQFAQVLLFIFGGILLAIFLSGLADFVTRRTGLWRPVSLALVVLAILAILASVCWLVGPRFGRESQALAEKVPQGLANLRQQLRGTWVGPFLSGGPRISGMLPPPRTLFGEIPGFLSTSVEALAMAGFVLFLGIYAAVDPEIYLSSMIRLAPGPKRARLREIAGLLAHALRWWLVGRIVVMILMGTLTTLGLWLLGVPVHLGLGILAGICQFVPYLGSFVAAAPALLIAFTQSPGLALEVGVLYIGIHAVEGYCATPLIQQRAVALPPAALLTTQVIMATLFGITGVIFASPLAVVCIVLVQTLYLADLLGDPVPVIGA